ncbi:hypothetical protein FNQ90_05085 [Streptomyces alkaliphilus]|uniref:Uncharacterized protein n=1 Tax=Streptomyces alkaliphilus TaxID=1472722 RepID=A0A7W3TB48_9ACTN|nr:hypothetical protein [Streptomyces alkaliphilus]MBB0243497.1 hypothetical protein [Streptomyces alkaliphilus]
MESWEEAEIKTLTEKEKRYTRLSWLIIWAALGILGLVVLMVVVGIPLMITMMAFVSR